MMKLSREEVLRLVQEIETRSLADMKRDTDLNVIQFRDGKFLGVPILAKQVANNMMICAQARWVLESDLAKAREDLSAIPVSASAVISAVEQMGPAMAGERAWDGTTLEYHIFKPILVGLLLADAREEFLRLCRGISSQRGAFEQYSRKHIVGEFVVQLADIGADAGAQASVAAFEGTTMFGPRHFAYGYHEMLFHIARRDMFEFERVRGEREAAFPRRTRSRVAVNQLDPWGQGALAQSATFDALGTALCRLAVWRGLPVSVDSRLYPKEFYL